MYWLCSKGIEDKQIANNELKMNILFLYSEVAGYFLASAETLYTSFGYKVHIITKPTNPEAPYIFPEYEGLTFYQRNDMNADSIYQLYTRLNPKFVYISGWGDKTYMQVAPRIRKNNIPVICSCDNQWKGNFRQVLAGLVRRRYLQNRFTHIFIAGTYQYPLAVHLGFKKRQVLMGMNTADLSIFHKAYHKNLIPKSNKYPHNFVYVGRFVEIKGLEELTASFIELSEEVVHDWTLTLVGAGALRTQLPTNDKIIYKDFLQQQELPGLAGNTGCFVLPSREEPWGVVLHEFAGAGVPLIASNICGAATAFIRSGYNGYLHEPQSKRDIKKSLLKIIEKEDNELIEMGKRSHLLSYHITKESWGNTLLSAAVNDSL